MAKKKQMEIGRNVSVEVNGDEMVITIDLSADTEPSASGKTLIVASTGGNKQVADNTFLGLNAYRYAGKKKTKK
jgi:hypothetical protein